ncbi:hypothetical protein MUY27_11870 [Mucilaginibacter sp. RS28]|uniref:Uncharacterized protein n=1 Tax=Mucilaginibacter straminoryzae TaxID=2932774 RepID=A0A9X2BDK1_9SPHI|nr:hypothetical protein [Mucilaginibacter straminoryzae]MCJ8210408.1 hypothetical protein [Mucilaginibacter straminoryzae]
MKRRAFVQALACTSTLAVINPLEIMNYFEPARDVVLPFIDGKKTVTILAPKRILVNQAQAQYQVPYGYQGAYAYGNMAPYQNWVAQQQAIAQWQQQMLYWQQQQYAAWLNQQHIMAVQNMMYQYQGQQIAPPQVWPGVRSIYGFAKDYSNTPTMIGVNEYAQPVASKETLRGAAKIFASVNQYYDEQEAERTTGPQTVEQPVQISIPNNSMTLRGKAYGTKNGFVAVSNPDQPVQSNDGRVGRLGKYVTGPDGEQYTVV